MKSTELRFQKNRSSVINVSRSLRELWRQVDSFVSHIKKLKKGGGDYRIALSQLSESAKEEMIIESNFETNRRKLRWIFSME
jgi:hypothetical protein